MRRGLGVGNTAIDHPERRVRGSDEPLIVRHDDDPGPFVARETAQQLHDIVACCCVEVRGRLVRKQKWGLIRQGAGNRDTLLFATGQVARVEVEAMGQPNSVKEIPSSVRGLWSFDTGDVENDLDVLESAQRLEEIEGLEHEADGLAADPRQVPSADGRDVDAVDRHRSPTGREQCPDER